VSLAGAEKPGWDQDFAPVQMLEPRWGTLA
jgi:hypothetical protein